MVSVSAMADADLEFSKRGGWYLAMKRG